MVIDAKETTLGAVATLQAGYPFRTGIEDVDDGEVSVVQMKDVDAEAGVDWAGTIRTQLSGRKQPDWIVEGDILFAAKGARFYAVHVTSPPAKAVCVPAFFHLRVTPAAGVDSEFLAWQLNQAPCQRQLLQAAEGSSQLSIRRPMLEQLVVTIPRLGVQRRIAHLARLALRERRVLEKLIASRAHQLRAIAEDLSIKAISTTKGGES